MALLRSGSAPKRASSSGSNPNNDIHRYVANGYVLSGENGHRTNRWPESMVRRGGLFSCIVVLLCSRLRSRFGQTIRLAKPHRTADRPTGLKRPTLRENY